MINERLDIRLDSERRRRLAVIAASQDVSVSQAVRLMIDCAYEQSSQADRLRAAQELAQFEIDDVPDPAALGLLLDETYAASPLSYSPIDTHHSSRATCYT